MSDPDPLDVPATGARLRALHQREVIDRVTFEALLTRASAGPTRAGWAVALDRLLLALGAGLCVAAVIYFFAGNWAALPDPVKLGSAALAVAACAGWALWAPDRRSGRIALTAAAGLSGALLAVYGQIYQTGADAWILFAAWAGLLVPWVLASRFEPLVILWLAVADLALWLAIDQGAMPVASERWRWILIAIVPALAWAVAEGLPAERRPARWFVRTVGIALFAVLTIVGSIVALDGPRDPDVTPAVVVLAAVAGGWSLGVLRGRPIDLLLATAALTSVIIVATAGMGRLVIDGWHLDLGGLFIMALLIIGQVSAAAFWLRRMWRAGAR